MAWKNPWFDPAKAHHAPDGFKNPEPETRQKGDFQRWRKERKAAELPKPPVRGYAQFIEEWWQPADLSGTEDTVWWLGHACLLLRLNNRYWLIDPALSRYASPLRFYGPERKTPAALDIASLPHLDGVLISHNHYDHLDTPTIDAILKRFPDVHFTVPLGLKTWFAKKGARRVRELDWWESEQQEGVTIVAVPARHWSARTLFDRNRSLWCGWVIQTEALNFWFSGDSGYSDNLLEISARLGPFNLAALPVGAYAPEWFMHSQHMDPSQAVSLYQAMGEPVSIPIHWGVFELADESLDAPPEMLLNALQSAGLREDRFSPWKIGARGALNAIYQEKS